MNNTQAIWMGKEGDYSWISIHNGYLDTAKDLFLEELFTNKWVVVATLDSGPLILESKELESGWYSQDELAYAPQSTSIEEIPAADYDEWYIFEDSPNHFRVADRFVNYGGFSLAGAIEFQGPRDSTWEALNPASDPNILRLREFWAQLILISPFAYIGHGDNINIACKDSGIIQMINNNYRL